MARQVNEHTKVQQVNCTNLNVFIIIQIFAQRHTLLKFELNRRSIVNSCI